MIVHAMYEENADSDTYIYIPDNPGLDIAQKQEEFFIWLFDWNHHHQYWRIVDGQKKYCEYDIDAFVLWLNEEVFNDMEEKARVLKEFTGSCATNSVILYF